MRMIDENALRREIEVDKYGHIETTITRLNIAIERSRVEAEPVKHGRWATNKYGYITCSICDAFPLEAMTGSLITMHYEPYESDYCPYCGAKMDLEEEEDATD